jgi:hypothetical protein
MYGGPMPLGFRGHCPDCNYDWDGKTWSVDCGRINFPGCDLRLMWSLFQTTQGLPSATDPPGRARSFVTAVGGFGRFCLTVCKAETFFQHLETHRCYVCSRCFVELVVPRRLNRRSWLAWVAEHVANITRSPLLFRACERVALILAGARSSHAPVPIDIGAIDCMDCGDRMEPGNINTNPLVCPRCKTRSARPIRGHPPWIIPMDYGSPDGEAVRRVILHLKELAENPKGHHPEGALTIPTYEGTASLWDRELDV